MLFGRRELGRRGFETAMTELDKLKEFIRFGCLLDAAQTLTFTDRSFGPAG